MANILFRTTPRILMGPGCADQIGPELKALKGKKGPHRYRPRYHPSRAPGPDWAFFKKGRDYVYPF